MDAAYERRLLKGINLPLQDLNSSPKNTSMSPSSMSNVARTPIKVQKYSDRYTPIRESSNWDIRFNMIQVI